MHEEERDYLANHFVIRLDYISHCLPKIDDSN
jgi:hypothetical protein